MESGDGYHTTCYICDVDVELDAGGELLTYQCDNVDCPHYRSQHETSDGTPLPLNFE